MRKGKKGNQHEDAFAVRTFVSASLPFMSNIALWMTNSIQPAKKSEGQNWGDVNTLPSVTDITS